MPQIEVKIIAFNPVGLGYVADIYVNGTRVHCGHKSHPTALEAVTVAAGEFAKGQEVAYAVVAECVDECDGN